MHVNGYTHPVYLNCTLTPLICVSEDMLVFTCMSACAFVSIRTCICMHIYMVHTHMHTHAYTHMDLFICHIKQFNPGSLLQVKGKLLSIPQRLQELQKKWSQTCRTLHPDRSSGGSGPQMNISQLPSPSSSQVSGGNSSRCQVCDFFYLLILSVMSRFRVYVCF